MENSLIFQTSPHVTLTNTFINVPVILKYEDINLIEVVKEEGLGFTTQIPIYHQDGNILSQGDREQNVFDKGWRKSWFKNRKTPRALGLYHGQTDII